MNFISIEFPLLFIVFLLIYWAARSKPDCQNILILLAGYGLLWNLNRYYAIVLFIYTLLIYGFSIWINKYPDKKVLFGTIVAILLFLVTLKYLDFFREIISDIIPAFGNRLHFPGESIIAPLGISFYTLNSITYLVSIKNREIQPAKFLDAALFLSFFPTFIAGPINRAKDLLPQIQTKEPRKITNPAKIYMLIIIALIKVLWLGESLAGNYVDPVFANPGEYHSLDIVFAIYMYAIQLYVNFSGYTDLVTAIALALGFVVPVNFDTPYLARNLREFWRRWHMSLSFWIKDYIYIPLGGSRKGWFHTQIYLLAAMLASGLWHGASCNYVIWGAIHGAGMICLNIYERIFGKNRISARLGFLSCLLTIHYVCFSWIFFRCPAFSDAIDMIEAIFSNFRIPMQFGPVFLFAVWLVFISYRYISSLPGYMEKALSKLPWWCHFIVVTLFIWLITIVSPPGIPQIIYAGF